MCCTAHDAALGMTVYGGQQIAIFCPLTRAANVPIKGIQPNKEEDNT